MRRYSVNRSSLKDARDLRRTFHDKEPDHETPVRWEWPPTLREVGSCEAVMYSSAKWQRRANRYIDYKHVAEGKQRLCVKPGFLRDEEGGGALAVVGPTVELNGMPRSFAVLAKVLGLQANLYAGTADDYHLPDDGENLYQIDIAGAWLGAARHPTTDETLLFVYTDSGVHCVITGAKLAIEKDGIVG